MSFDLAKAQDVKKYLELRKQQIEAQSKTRKIRDATGALVDRVTTGKVISQTQLACGCIIQEWVNQDGATIIERDWPDGHLIHTDGASNP